jgi:hypothetical protein
VTEIESGVEVETGAGAGVSSLAGVGVLAAGAEEAEDDDDEDEEDEDEELDEIVWPEAQSSRLVLCVLVCAAVIGIDTVPRLAGSRLMRLGRLVSPENHSSALRAGTFAAVSGNKSSAKVLWVWVPSNTNDDVSTPSHQTKRWSSSLGRYWSVRTLRGTS